MRAWLPILLLVAACTGDKSKPTATRSDPADCKLIAADPANAVAALSKKYAQAPDKVATVIETCIAPDGDPCQRIAKIVAAIPSMMPQAAAQDPGEVEKTCRGMPEAMRNCVLPSYLLAHKAECAKMLEDMRTTQIKQLDIRPQ